ncbi:unnamed protein product [Durusdinium trenchii]|uniref:DUF7869 domain-containing protein n=1 Tax=Durusdinium trenchii TaxID=1381693 RepID=A0ABP0IKK8_9DINO
MLSIDAAMQVLAHAFRQRLFLNPRPEKIPTYCLYVTTMLSLVQAFLDTVPIDFPLLQWWVQQAQKTTALAIGRYALKQDPVESTTIVPVAQWAVFQTVDEGLNLDRVLHSIISTCQEFDAAEEVLVVTRAFAVSLTEEIVGAAPTDVVVRGDIVAFLESLYESVAETLPDFRDELGDASSVQISVTDPYSQELRKQQAEVVDPAVLPGKKPRKSKRQVGINQARTSAEIEERWLPPGTMKEYFDQYVLQSSLEKPGSFPTFWRREQVWLSDFSYLQIRASSQHAQCATCIRHRRMIKSLGHHLAARQDQQHHYWRHLRDQYADRLVYYKNRGLSRLKNGRYVLMIQDGMDQGKVALPRSPWMKSKEYATFQRPKLHLSLTLCHGYLMLWSISNPDCKKDSNASIETIAYTLHLLATQEGVCLPECHIGIQADNTPRELKNNPSFRFMAAQVSASNLRACAITFLRCGHSHEDVDQCFGRLARHYAKIQCAQTPQDFVASTVEFSRNMKRPHETKSHVIKMNDTRDWSQGFA